MSFEYWATQSAVTDPGAAAALAINALEADIPALRRFASRMVLHYRARAADVPAGRQPEIHTRFASAMFDLILSRGEPSLSRDRSPADCVVGCCRDFTVVFLALARQKGYPARARVGFGSYFSPIWMMDHVVAEVWDGERWLLVDPQMAERDGHDWCNLTTQQFMTGPQAWKAAREGQMDPNKFLVDPSLAIEQLRGWPYLAHNVIHDLAAVSKTEMLLWDSWGMQGEHGPGPIPDTDAALLDEVSAVLVDPDVSPEAIRALASRVGLAVPPRVLRFDPYGGSPEEVDVSQALNLHGKEH